jgi:hypothetical protein
MTFQGDGYGGQLTTMDYATARIAARWGIPRDRTTHWKDRVQEKTISVESLIGKLFEG